MVNWQDLHSTIKEISRTLTENEGNNNNNYCALVTDCYCCFGLSFCGSLMLCLCFRTSSGGIRTCLRLTVRVTEKVRVKTKKCSYFFVSCSIIIIIIMTFPKQL
jgi:hypothetical protein